MFAHTAILLCDAEPKEKLIQKIHETIATGQQTTSTMARKNQKFKRFKKIQRVIWQKIHYQWERQT